MKLFLVGPKFDVENSNFPDYHRSAAYWRGLGHDVISTAEMDILEGADHDNGWGTTLEDEYMNDLFRRDVSVLVTCDAVILMENWKDDDQASLLAEIAEFSGMSAFEQIGQDNYYHELGVDDDEYEYVTTASVSNTFQEIIDRVVTLHNKKSSDYGKNDDPFYNMRASERYGIPAWVSCMIRSDDKSHRIQKAYTDGANSLVNESVIDSFEDKIIYDILALVLYHESLKK